MNEMPLSTLPLSSLPEMWDIFAAFDIEVEMEVSTEYTVRVSTQPFITGPADEPADTPFDGGLIQPLSFRRSILNGGDLGGLIAAQGEIVVDNSDGSLDELLKLWTFEETEVDVRVGDPDSAFGSRFQAFTGIADVESLERTRLLVPVRDRARWLDVPLVTAPYAGTGGTEGGEDLDGKRRPLSLGFSENVTPPLLDGATKLFQAGSGPIQAIRSVYANGVSLSFQQDYATPAELLGASIVAGKFATCAAEALFRLEYALDGTLITCDPEGDADGGFVGTVGAIIRRLAERAGVQAFDEAAFDSFETVHGYEAGAWFDQNDTSTITDAMRLVAGFGVFFGFRRDGRFTIGRIDAPTGYPALYIEATDILDDGGGIDRSPLPEGLSPPPWRWQVPWGRNWTVQTGTQLAGSVTVNDERRIWLSEQVRLATAQNAAIKAASRNPRERDPVAGMLRNKVDAEAEAARLLTLFRTPRSLYRVAIGREGHALDIGSIVNITYPRWDLGEGRNGLVVDIDEDAAAGRITLMVFT